MRREQFAFVALKNYAARWRDGRFAVAIISSESSPDASGPTRSSHGTERTQSLPSVPVAIRYQKRLPARVGSRRQAPQSQELGASRTRATGNQARADATATASI